MGRAELEEEEQLLVSDRRGEARIRICQDELARKAALLHPLPSALTPCTNQQHWESMMSAL
jgi:hypothetical protein